jgi:hypothetical protein
MARLHAESTAVVDATPEQVYAVFRDYRGHHARILPPEYFVDYHVEEGGEGAGTRFRLRTRVMGQERAFHMVASEPEPGRVLTETDLDTGQTTTFTFEPVAGGRCQVTIASDWEAPGGLMGLVERLATPAVMGRIFGAQLRRLAVYLRELDGAPQDPAR